MTNFRLRHGGRRVAAAAVIDRWLVGLEGLDVDAGTLLHAPLQNLSDNTKRITRVFARRAWRQR
jgi:hypothetical protein